MHGHSLFVEMPVHDDNGKAVGLLLYEDTATGNFVPRFISICFTSQKLKFYPPTVEVSITGMQLYPLTYVH